jgi:hypothetical protein
VVVLKSIYSVVLARASRRVEWFSLLSKEGNCSMTLKFTVK